jgi:hypothetical protein
MIIAEHTTTLKLTAETIWSHLVDVGNWKDWDDMIEFSELNDPLDIEAIGVVKHKNHTATSFMITEIKALQKLADIRTSYFGKFKFHREITKVGAHCVRFTQKIELINTQSVLFSPFAQQRLHHSMVLSAWNLLIRCQNGEHAASALNHGILQSA